MFVTALIFLLIVGLVGFVFRAHLKSEWAAFKAELEAQKPSPQLPLPLPIITPTSSPPPTVEVPAEKK
jgi:hypothetical protein